jgi:endonuclease/exonuclease/phosphatase family metal-dependent hydrolase
VAATGTAVLTKLPVLRSENHPLTSFNKGEQRGVLEVELQLPNNQPPLLFLATHLDYSRGSCERIASAREINQLIAEPTDDSCC